MALTGRQIKAAFARSNTWGIAASVTRQMYLMSTNGLDAAVGMVDDESFNQTFLLAGEVGDHEPRITDIEMQARYETMDSWFAGAMGSAAAPVVVSSQAANSLVAYRHVITLADALTHFWTLAIDETYYVLEIPTFKIGGYQLKVGENGRMMVTFHLSGSKTVYDSTVNTNSTVGGATQATLGTRLFRKDGVFRMNIQSAGSLTSSDAIGVITGVTLGGKQPLAENDLVFGQDYIIEPDNDGYPEFPVTIEFARMTSVTANSLALGLKVGRVFKADWTFTGAQINSSALNTPYSALWQFPALQIYTFQAPADGAGQVRPTAVFRAKQAQSAPTGMSGITRPYQLTIVNMNSQNLLT